MSDDEDESISEGFSASEDEWVPGKGDGKRDDGESSDDDDSDFEESIIVGAGSAKSTGSARKRETKNHLKGTGGGVSKKRKPMGQSLRARLYNKYRPPPKTLQTVSGSNSPGASTSRTASKNVLTPNEVSAIFGDKDDDGSSSDGSVRNHLVNLEDLDLHSSFFNVDGKEKAAEHVPPAFDCNAGLANLSDSDSEEKEYGPIRNEEKTSKAYDFSHLMEKVNSLKRMKEQIAKKSKAKIATTDDVTTLLALGENQHLKDNKINLDDDEDDEEDDDDDVNVDEDVRAPSKLNKTKSTRIKRHKKTRPSSTIIPNDDVGCSDDSDWEEVADQNDVKKSNKSAQVQEGIEIFVDTGNRKSKKEITTQEELEMAFRRKWNNALKIQQLSLHKASLLCLFARSLQYNRLLNDIELMQEALKILPGAKSYPKEGGADLKYYQSLVIWFKAAIKLINPNLYPNTKEVGKVYKDIREGLITQIKHGEANCKQNMVFIFVALLRGMGLQCRLVVNMQPLPLKPSQKELLPIKIKNVDNKETSEINDKAANVTSKKKSSEKPTHAMRPQLTNKTEKENSKSKNKKENEKSREKITDNKTDIGKHKDLKSKSKKVAKNSRPSSDENFENDSMEQKKEFDRNGSKKQNSERKKTSNNQKKEIDTKERKVEEEKLEEPKKIPSIKIPSIRDPGKNPLQNNQNTSINEDLEEKLDNNNIKSSKLGPKKTISTQKVNNSRPKRQINEKSTTNGKKLKHNETPNIDLIEHPTFDINRMSQCASVLDSGVNGNEPGSIPLKENLSIPKVISESLHKEKLEICESIYQETRRSRSRSRSISPRPLIASEFLETKTFKEKFSPEPKLKVTTNKEKQKQKENKLKISTDFLKSSQQSTGRILRSRKNIVSHKVDTKAAQVNEVDIPQLDGADDALENKKSKQMKNSRAQKQKKTRDESKDSDEDFQPSPPKQPKRASVLPKIVKQLRKDRRVLSTDNESDLESQSSSKSKRSIAADIWAEVWCDVENRWICIDLFQGKIDSVESNRKSASSNLAYVFAFQNDLSLKDVTARYCLHWSTVLRKDRVPKAWLEKAISAHYGTERNERDIREDHELRRIHEEKELPKSIAEFKDHPLYALERHLLKFQAIYPPNAPKFGFTNRGEPIYSRDCVHVLHSREIWLKQARTVKLGEKPYKIVKARPKWDKLTQSVIKDMPLEIFGFWQTEEYEPPTAENGIVPRNAYGNVELFKECMLPKKTAHIRLPGLNRICRKLGVDCANAVIGFDFHQGACHPTYDGFVVCEEFADQVTAAWYEDQAEQDRKEQEKYESRVYGNWKKLISGLIIRERLKNKYNF